MSTGIDTKTVTKNSNDLEDLGHSIDKTGKTVNPLGDQQSQLQDEINSLKSKISTTEKHDMQELSAMLVAGVVDQC